MAYHEHLEVWTKREQELVRKGDLHLARVLAAERLRTEGKSLREIGSALSLSHERVRQLLQ